MTRRELIEAGAGCGKTYNLVSRYLEAMGLDPETGAPIKGAVKRARPSEICAVTFTEDAALQMKERIIERLKKFQLHTEATDVLAESQISTFHSLCLRLLRPQLPRLGYRKSGSTPVPPPYARMLRSRHIVKRLSETDPVKTSRLLKHLDLHEVADLGTRLWFQLKSHDTLSRALDAELQANKDSFEVWRSEQRARIDEAFTAFPEAREATSKGWLMPFAQLLENPEAIPLKDFHFRGGRDIKKAFPELQYAAASYRAFLTKGLHHSLEASALAEESATQHELYDFLKEAALTGPQVLDFSALEFELSQVLQSGAQLMAPPKVLLVDEFQDTNRAQFLILSKISGADTEWSFVGDPKQSIYLFRGADVSLFISLSKRLHKLELSTNYRSEAGMMAFVNEVQAQLFADQRTDSDPPPQRLAAAKTDMGLAEPVRIASLAKGTDSFETFIESLERRRQELGPGASFAALFLSWKELFRFATALEEKRRQGVSVPAFRIAGSESWLKHPLTDIFAGLLEWIEDPERVAGIVPLLRWQRPGEWTAGLPAPSDIQALRESMGLGDPRLSWAELLTRFCHVTEPHRWLKGSEWAMAMEKVLHSLQDSRVDMEITGTELGLLIREFPEGFDIDLPLAQDSAPAELSLLTIHGSKGLEFDAVFLPELYTRSRGGSGSYVEEEESATFALRYVHPVSGESRRSLIFLQKDRERRGLEERERKRLFYVALTRAKRCLDIFAPALRDETETKPDAALPLGWPRAEPSYWNEVLERCRHSAPAVWRSIEGPDKEDIGVTAKSTVEWRMPQPCASSQRRRSFRREGVSRYLERLRSPARRAPVGASIQRELSRETWIAVERGEELHRLLEIWNGEMRTLDALLPLDVSRTILRDAALAVRKLPELKGFWSAVGLAPHTVFRELELVIHSPDYRLAGYADALWFPSPGELVLIDWKSSSSLVNLEKGDRRSLIRAQLELYAKPFSDQGLRVRGLAVGVEFTERGDVDAGVVIDEELLVKTSVEPIQVELPL